MRQVRVIAVAVICGLAAGCSRMIEHTVKSDVAAHLVDPASAQFRNVHQVRDDLWVGEVDAKTGGGVYKGYEPFTWTRRQDGHGDVAIETD